MFNSTTQYIALFALLLTTGSGITAFAASEDTPTAQRSALMHSAGESCHTWSGEITAPTRLRFPITYDNALVRTRKSEVYYTLVTPTGDELHGEDALHFREPYLYFVAPVEGEYTLNVSGYPEQTISANYEVCEF